MLAGWCAFAFLSACGQSTDEPSPRRARFNDAVDEAAPRPVGQQQLADQAASGQDGFYDLYSTVKTPITLIEEKRFINTLAWNLSDEVTLKNILAYTHLLTNNGSNIFGTYFQDPTNPAREFSVGASVVNPEIPVTNQESYVAELQLQGTSFGDSMTSGEITVPTSGVFDANGFPQFTLVADTKKGSRPGFSSGASPEAR